ncbi:hypothetical protein ACOI1C_18650 [Bacillus sp. DJP31]|uniref:hypothetical protein n=1 Tax=Bacillus sp. DJP31 TaxID=3409789 RepID=UPI003BB76EBF
MRFLKFICISFFLIASTLFFQPSPSYACSCIQPPPVDEEYKQVTAVFSGKVIDIKNQLNPSEPMKVTFQVDQSWKGVSEGKISIYTAKDSAACGYAFNMDDSYLVYASEYEGKLNTGLCSLTKELSAASEDLVILGEGEVLTNDQDEDTPLSITVIVLGFMLIAGLGYVVYSSIIRK